MQLYRQAYPKFHRSVPRKVSLETLLLLALHHALAHATNLCTVFRRALLVLGTRLALGAPEAPELALLCASCASTVEANRVLALDVSRALGAERSTEALLERVDGAVGALPTGTDLASAISVTDAGLTFITENGRHRIRRFKQAREALLLGFVAVLDALLVSWGTPALVGTAYQPRVATRAFRKIA